MYPTTTCTTLTSECSRLLDDCQTPLWLSVPHTVDPGVLLALKASQKQGLVLVLVPDWLAAHRLQATLEQQGNRLRWATLTQGDAHHRLQRIQSHLTELDLLVVEARVWLNQLAAPVEATPVPLAHVALVQAHRLLMEPVETALMAHLQALQPPGLSVWTPVLLPALHKQLEARWPFHPIQRYGTLPNTQQLHVTVYRKASVGLKKNKLLRLLQRRLQQPHTQTILLTRTPGQADDWAEQLQPLMPQQPVPVFGPSVATARQRQLMGEMRQGTLPLLVAPLHWANALACPAASQVQWLVIEPLEDLASLQSLVLSHLGEQHAGPRDLVILHARDDVLTRQDSLRQRLKRCPNDPGVLRALAGLKQWHRWIQQETCRKVEFLSPFSAGDQDACWLQPSSHYQPCGQCDRCQASSRWPTLIQLGLNRLMY